MFQVIRTAALTHWATGMDLCPSASLIAIGANGKAQILQIVIFIENICKKFHIHSLRISYLQNLSYPFIESICKTLHILSLRISAKLFISIHWEYLHNIKLFKNIQFFHWVTDFVKKVNVSSPNGIWLTSSSLWWSKINVFW